MTISREAFKQMEHQPARKLVDPERTEVIDELKKTFEQAVPEEKRKDDPAVIRLRYVDDWTVIASRGRVRIQSVEGRFFEESLFDTSNSTLSWRKSERVRTGREYIQHGIYQHETEWQPKADA